MKSVSTLLWLVASASLFACGSADSSGRPGSGGGQGPTSSGQGGTSAGLGGTSATGSGGSGGAITGSTSSGGSTGTSGGGVAGTIMTNTGNGSTDCGRKMFSVTPKPAEILIILDRSASMLEPPDGVMTTMSKWSQVVPAVNQVVTDTNATVSWGLKTFPEGSANCNVTSNIDVNVAPMNSTAVTGAITSTTPEGNGTPTSTAIDSGVAYLKTLTDNNPKYILLATDGEPSCPGSSDAARLASVASVTNAFNAGFHTFVVGVATTKATSTTVLNQLADAGGEATGDANPLANRFYLASTKDAIVTTLKQITGVVASCSFDLGGPPPDVNNIAVKVAGDKAPQDATNGWSYTSPDNSQLTINGSWCDKVKASTDAVQIVFACPGDIIN